MCMPTPPAPPDPKETSAAQTGTNVSTAIANSYLGNVNQVTPYGDLSYEQTGSYTMTDPYTGETYQVPTWTATQTLTPEQQAILDQQTAASQNMATLAANQSEFLNDYMASPVDLSSQNIDAYSNTHFADDFNTQWDRQQSQLENQLAQQGVAPGSAAYTQAMNDLYMSKQGAYDNMLGDMYSTSQGAILTERNQPLNEITALMSGSQVSQPGYVNTSQPQIPTTDTAGLINQNYNQQLGIYNQQSAYNQSLMGGLFSLGAAFI